MNLPALAIVLILLSGCATNRTTMTAGKDPQASNGPESRVTTSDTTKTRWWEYALMPVSVGCGMLLWYNDLPGIAK
jgi:hypothetical protein